MAQVTGLRMVGGAYHNGRYSPGWNNIELDNGQTIYIPDTNVKGMNRVLDKADQKGHDTTQYRNRLETWVKTGQMPPHKN